jgi:mRNA-degrading endonuclease toxin of MazEF toxin-antitoxin module
MFQDKRRGDVYWLNAPDPKPGSFLIGKNRPVLIVSSDEVNASSRTVIVVPLTSSINQRARGDGTFDMVQLDGYTPEPNMLLPRQVHAVDASDLGNFCYHLTDLDMARVDAALRRALWL